MNDELFNELVESIRDVGAYLRGEPVDVRVTFVGEPDPRAIRERLGVTQERFAAMLGIDMKTLEDWEHGRREPTGPAMRLLQIADRHPEIMLEAA